MGNRAEELSHEILAYAMSGRVWPSGRKYVVSEWGHDDQDFDVGNGTRPPTPEWSPSLLDGDEVDCAAIRAALYHAEAHYKNEGYLDETVVIPIEGKHITGSLNCIGEEFILPLKFLNCTFENGINLKDSHLRMLALQKCRIPFLSLKRAKINGSVLVEGSHILDGINLRGAEINGAVALKGTRLDSETGEYRALDLRKGTVKASIFMRNGLEATGVVDLSASRIHGDVDFGKATLSWKPTKGVSKSVCIKGKSARIGGSLFLNNDLKASGQIDFRRAAIGSRVNVEKCSLSVTDDALDLHPEQGKFALNLEHATIRQDLSLKHLHALKGDIGLQNADAKNFSDDPEAWLKNIDRYKGKIWLTGFRYTTLTTPQEPKARKDWMKAVLPDSSSKGRLVRQPWEQMAAVLRSLGQYRAADELMIEIEQRSLKQNSPKLRDLAPEKWTPIGIITALIFLIPKLLASAVMLIYRALVRTVRFGYGNGYYRIIQLFAFLWCINFFVFGIAAANGRMKPVEEEVAVYMDWRQLQKVPVGYVEFNTPMYALDIFLPIDLSQQSKWIPVMHHEGPVITETKDVSVKLLTWTGNGISSTFSNSNFTNWLPAPLQQGMWERTKYVAKGIPMLWSWANILAGWTGFIMIGAFFAGTIRKSLES